MTVTHVSATRIETTTGHEPIPEPPVVRRAPLPSRPWGWIAFVLLGQAFVLADLHVPVVRPLLGLALLAGLPVLALARRVFAPTVGGLVAVLYALGVVTLTIILGGLALNTVLPWAGIDEPLGLPVLVAASTFVDLALVGGRSYIPLVPRGYARQAVAAVLRARLDPAVVLGVASVVLAVAGAVRLNNGLGGGVAVFAHAVAVVALGAALLRRGSSGTRITTVYLAGLALLLGTSLRGWYITGHDIQNEYLAYLYTHNMHHWVMDVYQQPYNACLSVNILPSVLTDYLGVTGVFVFKVALQVLFAIVPVVVYVTARRMLPPRVAVLSAAIFVFFPTFFTDMPFLVRQEVAYVFVALALLAATQQAWTVRWRQGATFTFGVGVVLSHYSTTYVLVITLFLGMAGVAAGAAVQAWRSRRFRAWARRVSHARPRMPRRMRPPLVLLGPIVVIALSVTAWAWSSPATHSSGHLADTVTKLTDSLIHGNATAGSSDLNYSILGGGGPTPEQRFRSYADDALDTRNGNDPSQYVFPDPSGSTAHPALAEQPNVPQTGVGSMLAGLGLNVAGLNALAKTAAGMLFQLFLAIGLLALMVHARATRRLSREQFWLVLGSVGALGAVVVVPGLSADYGVLRAFQQTLLFAAPLLAVGVVTATRRLGRHGPLVAGGLVLGMGAILSGAAPAVVGDYPGILSQDDSGQYFDLLYADAPQISATRWLAHTAGGEGLQTVTASDIVSITRLQQYLPPSVTVIGDFLPSLLRKDTYVFFTPQTGARGRATVFYTGDLLTYRYPTGAVDERLDLVYSSGGTEIYR